MSQKDKKPRVKESVVSWGHLRNAPEQPKGPAMPWSSELNQAAEEFVDFLQNSESKKAVKDFIIDSYKKFEGDKIARLKARVENEAEVSSRGAQVGHEPGNIEPAMHEHLNMTEVEQAFVRSLKGTQSNLVRSVEDRVEEMNRLLSGIGGFSAQLKSSFARSTVVFLEQEDPKFAFRERLIFSVNLPNFDLKHSWEDGEFNQKSRGSRDSDGRTSLQATWDEAVNTLAKIVEATGLKPKYCKNDRHYGRFVMKQDLRSRVNLPDEYFSFILDYNTNEKIKEMCIVYDKMVIDYEIKIKKLENRIRRFSENSKSSALVHLKQKHLTLTQELEFFIGSTPDPNQIDEGLLFQIEVSTLKDYHIVKDRMQSIMTRYILYLSKIASKDAMSDEDLRYQLEKAHVLSRPQVQSDDHSELIDDLDSIPEYKVDSQLLTLKSKTNEKAGQPLSPRISAFRKQPQGHVITDKFKKKKIA